MAKLDVPVIAIRGERNTPIEMRDGTVLRADIFRTDSAGSHPVLLIRNPYGEPTATEADFVVAEQTIRHDAEHPSYITLPVIPRSGPGLAEEAR